MIKIKTAHEIVLMRKSGEIAREAMALIEKNIKPGISTKQLNDLAQVYIERQGAIPSCLGYNGYPASICTSVNEEVVHGIPSARELKEGDIISIDLCVNYKGYNTDLARTYPVGKISKDDQKLIDVTRESFFEGIKNIKEGSFVGDISSSVQQYVEKHGFSVVRDLVGHGIGKSLHEDPSVPNFGIPGFGPRLHAGTTICVEPMVNRGAYPVTFDKQDGWTVRTKDGKKSAHFENTILITEEGVEILT
jgi:methionyl aminopeptidase